MVGKSVGKGVLISVRRVQFFPTRSNLKAGGAFVPVFNNRGRGEFSREKTNLNGKQFPILEITSSVNIVFVEVGWGFS